MYVSSRGRDSWKLSVKGRKRSVGGKKLAVSSKRKL